MNRMKKFFEIEFVQRNRKRIAAAYLIIWLVVTTLTGYLIYHSAVEQLRNDLIFKTDWNYFQKGLSATQNLVAKIGGYIMLKDVSSLKKAIGKEIESFEGLKFVAILDRNGDILAHTGPTFTLPESIRSVHTVGKVSIEVASSPENDIIIGFSSNVFFLGENVGKVYVALPASHLYGPLSRCNTLFIGWMVFSILLLLPILLAIDRQKKPGLEPSSILLLSAVSSATDRQKKPGLEPITTCKLENTIVMFFQYIILEIALLSTRLWEQGVNDCPQETEGMRLGPYILKEKIARGKMAELFLAQIVVEDIHRKKFAVKRVWPHLAENQGFIKILKREVKLSELLGYHPNIVQTFGFREKENAYFIVMEYVSGMNLAQIMAEAKEGLSVNQSVFIISQICLGLKHACSDKDNQSGKPGNIIHGDIKPSNILISFQGDVKISDFGISKASSKHSLIQAGLMKGKLLYISLEEALGQAVVNRADIYALGAIFYEILSGKRLYELSSGNEITPLKELVPDMPDRLNSIVMKCLEKDEKFRYQSAQELLGDLTQLNHSFTVTYDMSSFSYMSPEQALGQTVDHRADIYALGIVFYEILSGKRLYRFSSDIETIRSIPDRINRYCYLKTRLEKEITPIKELIPDIPNELNDIVMKCLENDKESRYQSAHELYEDLKEKLTIAYDKSNLADFMKERFQKDSYIGEKTFIKLELRR